MLNYIIDVSHWQKRVKWAQVKASGIQGVMVKATQGRTIKDDMYDSHTAGAKGQGMLHGAYHFGTFGSGRGKDQADHFLNIVKPNPETLLALDFEDDPRGPDMTGEAAAEFVQHIKEAHGRWPMFYSANYWTKPHLPREVWSVLKNCPLWLAGYVKESKLVIPQPWTDWTIWQYTEGVHGIEPRDTPGIGACDRGMFRGTAEDLRAFWTRNTEPAGSQIAVSSRSVPQFTPGVFNAEIQAIQRKLLALGYKLPKFGADGKWGKESSLALAEFEVAHPRPNTGELNEWNYNAVLSA